MSRGFLSSLRAKILLSLILLSFFPTFLIALFVTFRHGEVINKAIITAEINDPSATKALESEISNIKYEVAIILFVFSLLLGIGVVAISSSLISPLHKMTLWISKIKKGEKNSSLIQSIEQDGEVAELSKQIRDIVSLSEETSRRAISISETKNEFIAIIAHQLRTPLTSIKWALDDLKTVASTDKDSAHKLEVAVLSSVRMVDIINNLLDVISIEEGKFGYFFETCDIWSDVVLKIVSEYKKIAENKGIKLDVINPDSSLPAIQSDKERLRIAVANLISNSIFYTPKDGIVTIAAHFLKPENELEISIRDSGVGIPRKELSKLFTKFFRAANAIRMQPNGSGLGLFIAKNIIEAHKGRIWAESEEGQGSTFHFTIPISKKGEGTQKIAMEKFMGLPSLKEKPN